MCRFLGMQKNAVSNFICQFSIKSIIFVNESLIYSFFMKLYYTVISAFSRKYRILAREINIIQDIQEVITTMRTMTL